MWLGFVVYKHCLDNLNEIYNTVVPRLKRPVYSKNKKRPRKIKKTNVLAMHKDYRQIYSLETYFMDKKIASNINFDYDNFDFAALTKTYSKYCAILSIFSIGHFNYSCSENSIIDFNQLDMKFIYKKWNLKLKTEKVDDVGVLTIIVNKEKEHKIVLVPTINMNEKNTIMAKIKYRIKANEYFCCIPFEKNEYEADEICLDIGNIESFRRIQQLVLKAMILSDSKREDCPFCNHHLTPSNKEGRYECEGCRTVIVDSVCPQTHEKYTYTDILGYEKENVNYSEYRNEKWLYHRKMEAILYYRNITKLDEDGQIICPICQKKH